MTTTINIPFNCCACESSSRSCDCCSCINMVNFQDCFYWIYNKYQKFIYASLLTFFYVSLILPIVTLIMASSYKDDINYNFSTNSTTSNSKFNSIINFYQWMIAYGSIEFLFIILNIILIFSKMCCYNLESVKTAYTQSSHIWIIFVFDLIWIIIGSIMLWKDCTHLQPYRIYLFVWFIIIFGYCKILLIPFFNHIYVRLLS
jgi:hypothetical protein